MLEWVQQDNDATIVLGSAYVLATQDARVYAGDLHIFREQTLLPAEDGFP